MKAHVWYGPNGVILAVGSIQGHARITPTVSSEGVKVVEVDVSKEGLNKLHETHKIDLNSRQLVAR